jgi:hypothetical protein
MRFLLLLFLVLSFSSGLNAQFSPIWTIPSDYLAFNPRALNMNDNGVGLVVCTAPYDGSGSNSLNVYHTNDFGNTWDTTFIEHESMIERSSFITSSGIMYLSTVKYIYPTSGTNYQLKKIHHSTDFGATWLSASVDSVIGQNREECIKFLNDSIGAFYYGNGIYVTMDYGSTWTNVLPKNVNNLSITNDGFVGYQGIEAFTYNPYTQQVDSFDYFPYSNGSVNSSAFTNGVGYRGILSSQGTSVGSNYNFNFASLNIDTLPLGNQSVIHFPQNFALTRIDVTNSCIHMVMDGSYVRSCNNTNSFNSIDAFNGDPNEFLVQLDFINDTVGFAITINQALEECKFWKTTNGGGSSFLPVTFINYDYGLLDVEENNIELSISPNPGNGVYYIKSDGFLESAELCSLEGKKVFETEINSTTHNLDIRQLPAGSYLLHINTANGSIERKLMKM